MRAERDGRRRDLVSRHRIRLTGRLLLPLLGLRRLRPTSCSVAGAMDVETLRKIPLFESLGERALARVAELATEFEEPAGWVLVEVGQPGSGMFVLEEGTVTVQTPDGREWDLGPGEFFGELALLTDHPRNARIRAKTPVRCLAISRMDFAKLLKEEPEIAVAMLPRLAQRVDAPH
jgi:CRP-like cAMP-binding protein